MLLRAFHGVNLAGWLTLEPWVTPELFADSGALDEPTLISSLGATRYRKLVDKHRKEFMSQADFTQIAARGFNAVRLSVPWYVFGHRGPEPGPYVGCIKHVDHAFDWAEEVGLNVLLALAVSPGSAYDNAALVRDQVNFSEYRADLLNVLGALSQRYASRIGLLGIEVADDPRTQEREWFSLSDGIPLHSLRNYYRDAYDVIRANAGQEALVVLPDAGRPKAWRGFMAQDSYHNVWLDCHLFHHTDHVDASGPSAVRSLVDKSRRYLAKAEKSGLPTMVGKWSASLPYADSMMTPEGRIALARVYVSEQVSAFASCPGWFFQTWKTSGRLVGWDARVALATFERRMLD
ncbi:MAG: cellulase family glycosylhydrolase [Atopobiaceae bacterium]|nr:cellulase family glycosylhydrolase [Atopobiaceae bacterium]